MKTSALTMLPATSFGIAMENYDGVSTSFSSVPVKAAAYYTKNKTIQTVSWYLTGFVGTLTFEATLDTDPALGLYFPISATISDGITPLTGNDALNIKGNYTWLRATITDFTAGNINKVIASY